jgi:hypothetical protein
VCVLVGLAQAGLVLLAQSVKRPRWLRVSRRQSQVIAGVIAAVVLAVVVVGFAAGAASHLWTEFKEPNPPSTTGNSYFRLLSVAGSHRYQYWQVAAHAFDAHPWDGIGPGTFQYYWAQHQTLGEYVQNAHSLWFETLAELGIVGLALIGGFFAFVLVAGTVRAFRSPPKIRLTIATAVATLAAFCAAAAFDWVWQIGVMPLIAMLLVAVTLGGDDGGRSGSPRSRLVTRAILAVAAILSLWAIAVPLASTLELRSSQRADLAGQFDNALIDAATAQNVEPDAASPRFQRALILEQLGDIKGASEVITGAEAREPTNWAIWLVASRLATESNRPRLALADYVRARSLNPTSPIFK